jgi:mRNA interferase RelE/StbE
MANKYRVRLSPEAIRDLRHLSAENRRLVARHISVLGDNPYPPGCRKLAGSKDLFRIRAGDYRIIYQVKRVVLIVLVIRIGHRREIYR